jgi:hypothetical protein
MEFSDFNAGTGALTISNNTFVGTGVYFYTNALRLKNNYTGRTTLVSNNTFTDYVGDVAGYGGTVSLENYQAVTLNGNTFTPLANSTTYRHVTINTKDWSSSSGFYQPAVGATLTNNVFNGSGTPGGVALAFYNWDNDNPTFNAFVLGTAGNENIFNTGIGKFILLDNSAGTVNPMGTTMVPWALNMDAVNNKFDVGSGLKLPVAMTLADLFLLEDKVQHAIDDNTLGFVKVKDLNTYVTVNSFVAPATTTAKIQRGIDAAGTPGWTVNVGPGTFDNNLDINKSIALKGENRGVPGCSTGRVAESKVVGATGGAVMNITADNVVIDGFEITNPSGNYAITATGRSGLDIINNNIHHIGTAPVLSGNTHAIAIVMGSTANIADIDISDNCIDEVKGGENPALTGTAAKTNNGSAAGIGVGWSDANYDITGLTIERNTISNVDACTKDFSEGGKGAYGVIINVGAKAVNVGKAVSPLVKQNTIHHLEGLWAHGIGLEGETPGAQVLNNDISYLTDYKTPTDAVAVLIEENDGAATVVINDNSFTNTGLGIQNKMTALTVSATCNWYGTTDGNTIATKVSGDVDYDPWLVNGSDDDPSAPGFQPVAGACAGSTVIITSAVPDHIICGETSGSILVSWTGGSPNYTVNWGSGSVSGITTAYYDITGLAAGTYTITVTDLYGTFDTETITVEYQPVHNVTQNTYHQTIQAGIIAATANNVLNVCAGIYEEVGQIVIDKNLTIIGAGTTATIVKPAQNTGSSGDARGWVIVAAGIRCDLSQMTLDGTGYKIWQGIRHLGEGDIDHVKFTNIQYDASGPSYAGTAVAAFGGSSAVPMNVDVTNCEFSGIGRVGVLYFGTGITASTYSNNTYVGKGTGDWLDYGVEVGAGASPTIQHSSFTNCLGIASVDNSKSAGIVASTYFGAGTTAIIDDCDFDNNQYGIHVGISSTDASAVEIKGNCGIQNSLLAGIRAVGSGTTVNIHDNLSTITGNAIGVEITNAASANLTNNTITANTIGVSISGGGNLLSSTGNAITANTDGGIMIASDAGTIGAIENNNISGNGYNYDATHGRGLQSDLATVVDASPNWWGHISGPYNTPANLCGQGNAVIGNVTFDPWYSTLGGPALVGFPAITTSSIPIINTVTNTPVVISETVTYPDLTGYDPALLTDAVISTSTAFPAGSKVIAVIYTDGTNAPVNIPVNYDLTTATSHYLSDILGNAAPYGTQLAGHSLKTINWQFVVEGANAPGSLTVVFQPVAYLDRAVCVSNHGVGKSFNITYADVDFVYTPPAAPPCFPGDVEVFYDETYPLIASNGGARVLNDSRWEFYSDAAMTQPIILPVNATITVGEVNGLGAFTWSRTSTLTTPVSYLYGSAVVTEQGNPSVYTNGQMIPLERPIATNNWKAVIGNVPAGTYYIKVKNLAMLDVDGTNYNPQLPIGSIPQGPHGTFVEYPYDVQSFMVNYVGAAGVTIDPIDDISTITKTPVIIEATVDYGDAGDLDDQVIDPSVMVDALIEFNPQLPSTAHVVSLLYNGTPVTLTNTAIGSVDDVLLSYLIGAPAPTALAGHDGLVDTWTITVAGMPDEETYTVTFNSIAYVDYNDCHSVLATEVFDVTYADATLDLTLAAEPVCYPTGVAHFEFELNHPAMANVDHAGIRSNAVIVSDKEIPAGTVIEWRQEIDRGSLGIEVNPSTPPGVYTVPAATYTIYLSQIVTGSVAVTTSPFQLEESDPIFWEFDIEGLIPGTYNFDIQAAAQLADGTLYPYATMTPAVTINVAGALGVTIAPIDDISTITKTPVIIKATVDYGDAGDLDDQVIDPSVMVDALIGFDPQLPSTAHVVSLLYNGTPVTLTNTAIGSVDDVLLSYLIGAPAPTALAGHDGLIDNWTITVAGMPDEETYTVTFSSIAYVDYNDCYSVLATEEFDVTYADATLDLTLAAEPVCYPTGVAHFEFELNHPAMANVDHAGIRSNAVIVSDKEIPAGTVIEWRQEIDRGSLGIEVNPSTPPGVYTVPAATYTIYLSQIVTGSVAVTTSPFQLEESDPIFWEFDIAGLVPGTYNFDIQAAAQLADGTLYPYATMTPPVTINVAGAQGVTMDPVANISTVTSTPVIIPVSVTYPDLSLQNIDVSVLTDARITYFGSGSFPAGTRIFDITYNGTSVMATPVVVGGQSEVFLSDLLGAANPLLGHSNLTVNWELYVDGITAAVTVPVKVEAIAYVDKSVCYSVMDDLTFSITYAGMDVFALGTTPAQVMCGQVTLTFSEDFPAIIEVDPSVLSNAKITVTSANPIPAGTTIAWSTSFGNGTYNVTSPLTSLYVSDMLGAPAANPLVWEDNAARTWTFVLSGATLDQYDYDLKIDGIAQLDGVDYVYATTTQSIKGLPTVTLTPVPDISTITSTPVIIPATVTYPATISALNSVLTDARLDISTALPTGAVIEKVTYSEGSGVSTFPVNFPAAGYTSLYLSDILGSTANPLNGHAGLTVDWTFTLSGVTAPYAGTITVTPVAYQTKGVCESVIGNPDAFTLTFADLVSVALTPDPAQVICDNVTFTFDITYPTIQNIDNGTGDIKNNAVLKSSVALPASVLTWSYNGNPGTPYSVAANTTQIYLSDITGMTASLEAHNGLTDQWVFNLSGTGLAANDYTFTVENVAQLNPDYIYNTSTTQVKGLPTVTLTPAPDISTITSTPVIIPATVTYPATISALNSVLTDARLDISTALPTGAVIEKVTYSEGSGVSTFPVNFPAAGYTSLYLSDILGSTANPLNGHAGLTVDWTFTLSGVASGYTGTITVTPVAYQTKGVCESEIGTADAFNLTFAPATFTVTPIVPTVCGTDPLSFSTSITYPAILNIDNGTGDIRADALITAATAFPAGTTIAWSYNSGLATGTYNLPAASGSILLSTIVGGTAPNPLEGHSGTDNWSFVITNAGFMTGNVVTIQPIAVLSAVQYPYQTGSVTLTVNDCEINGYYYYNNIGGPISLADDVTVSLYQNNVLKATTTTDATGYYSFNGLSAGTYEIRSSTALLPASINATDASLVNAWNTLPVTIDKVRFLSGDVGVPGNYITSYDAFRILDHYLSLGTIGWNNPNAGIWSFWKKGETISVNGWIEGLYPNVTVGIVSESYDMYGMVTGDFNGSYDPTLAKSGTTDLYLNTGNTVGAAPDAEVLLPVTAGMDMQVGAISMTLHYPADKVIVEGVYLAGNPGQPVMHTAQNGQLRIGWFSGTPLNLLTGDPLITLKLKTTAAFTNGETIRFELSNDPMNELADGQSVVIPNALLFADVLKSGMVGVEESPSGSLITIANYPNPFSDRTTVAFSIPRGGKATLEVTNALGQRVETLFSEDLPAGHHSRTIETGHWSQGIYFATLKLKTEQGTESRTIRLVNRK